MVISSGEVVDEEIAGTIKNKQEVPLKKITVEGYRAVASLNTKKKLLSVFKLFFVVLRAHHVVRKHLTAIVTDIK